MNTIIVTPKFTKENLLLINLENLIGENFKLCFSLVYSIESSENAIISKQVGRYYEFLFNTENVNFSKSKKIILKLQTPFIGSYNQSCGPEGLFILDEKENLIPVYLKRLTFDNSIEKKEYAIFNEYSTIPIIPEPTKNNLGGRLLKNSESIFYIDDLEMRETFMTLKKTTALLNIDFNNIKGIKINFIQKNMDNDSYKIVINSHDINVYSNSYGGKFYAIISILQLSFFHLGNLPTGEIEDNPRFKWRGMHLDCSRQYYSVKQIKRLLIYMSIFKLNRFHWHLTDNEAWRLDLKSYPNLAKQSSFRGYKQIIPPVYGSGYNKTGGFYSNDDVKDLISFAKKLNIEIMPEIDLPAHSWALIQCMPELYDHTSNFESSDVGSYKDNTINPALKETWSFLTKTIAEISNLFSYDFVHVGVDERPKTAWEGSAKILNLMRDKNFKTFDEVQDFYTNKIINLLKNNNKKTAAWNEAALSPFSDIGSSGSAGNIDRNCLIFAWEHEEVATALVKKGFKTIMCPGQKTYFDMAYNNSTEERGICWASTIETSQVHEWNPLLKIEPKYHNLILGLQGQLWSETITKTEHMDLMINPRLATLAEVAWSSDKRRGWKEFRSALKINMKLMSKLGWENHEF